MTRPLSRLRPSSDDPTGVQQLLATLPDPGPMPPALVDRITTSLRAEQEQRATGPHDSAQTLTGATVAHGPWRRPLDPSVDGHLDGDIERHVGRHVDEAAWVAGAGRGARRPLRRIPPAADPHRRRASHGLLLALSGAAAAAAVGGVVLINGLAPRGGPEAGTTAALSVAGERAAGAATPNSAPSNSAHPTDGVSSEATSASRSSDADLSVQGGDAGAGIAQEGRASARPGVVARPQVHVQLSSTRYTDATLVAAAGRLWRSPGPAVPPLAAESPAFGRIATPLGMSSCVQSLDVDATKAVADLATYDGQPAAVIVTDGPDGRQVRVVSLACGSGSSAVLAGPLAVR